ncbi:GTP-binding protein Rho1 [Mortierella polycephala]|uniref:GTP-binding protein Rho1 n=1 Tax=Mortierella polycephala TaxID=41804 RepID=A0A9P6U1A3_9FUNG|nr:GTP-binding protein Rho1 [Mortierella polycephala]
MPDVRKKLVVVGDGACGKTCMLMVYSKNDFPKKYVPTVFENYAIAVPFGKQQVELSLWDTAGQEDYDRLRPLSYPESDVVLMCFSVDTIPSLDNLTEKWHPELAHFLESVSKIVVGLKTDLRDEAPVEEKDRFVSYDRGSQVAASLHCKYYECSAKTGKGLPEVFQAAVKAAMQSRMSNIRKRACSIL